MSRSGWVADGDNGWEVSKRPSGGADYRRLIIGAESNGAIKRYAYVYKTPDGGVLAASPYYSGHHASVDDAKEAVAPGSTIIAEHPAMNVVRMLVAWADEEGNQPKTYPKVAVALARALLSK